MPGQRQPGTQELPPLPGGVRRVVGDEALERQRVRLDQVRRSAGDRDPPRQAGAVAEVAPRELMVPP